MMRKAFAVAVAVLAVGVFAAETSGPDKGSAPMLMIKPVNREGAAYCMTCKAGMNPAVQAFVTKDDEATRALLTKLDEQVKAHADAKLNGTAVVVGEGDAATSLVAWAKDSKLGIPLAVVAADADGLKPWKLNDKVATTVVFFNKHKVDHSTANQAADKLADDVAALLK